MSNIRKNEAGFSPIEVVVVLVIVALIGVVGWFVYKDHNKTNNSAATASAGSANSSTQTPDAYVGWKTYTSKDEAFSMKYPDGWSVTNEPAEGNLKESITLVGPNNFDLTYTLVKYDATFTVSSAQAEAKAVGSPDPVKANVYSVIDSFAPKNLPQTLYVVSTSSDVGEAGGPVNAIELSAYKDYQSQPLGYPGYYIAKHNSGYIVQLVGGYHKAAPSSGLVGMPTATFLAKGEVKTAGLILKSISY